MNQKVEIVDFRPEYKDDFVRFNSDWISEYFKIEEADIKIFADPKTRREADNFQMSID